MGSPQPPQQPPREQRRQVSHVSSLRWKFSRTQKPEPTRPLVVVETRTAPVATPGTAIGSAAGRPVTPLKTGRARIGVPLDAALNRLPPFASIRNCTSTA